MAVYWMTEALPLPITSMIPMVALPLLGIMSTGEVAINYLNSTNYMFLGKRGIYLLLYWLIFFSIGSVSERFIFFCIGSVSEGFIFFSIGSSSSLLARSVRDLSSSLLAQ
jgi:hypothetical protein